MRENAFESNERVLAAVCGEEVAGFATFSNRDELPPEYSFTPLSALYLSTKNSEAGGCRKSW